ncbi:unnamed protein product [Cochlearia groenlandica]
MRDMKMQRSHETMMTRILTQDPQDSKQQEEDTMDYSACKTWKLYDNPYYLCSQSQQHQQQQQRKAYIWDMNFIRVFMESELDKARAEIKDLKEELDCERKARKRVDLLNKKLAKDVEEEKVCRETEEMHFKKVLEERSFEKSEIVRMKKDIEEERQMHKLAEVLREERVQMKLMDARLFLEEKLSELEGTNEIEEKEKSKMKMKPMILERARSLSASRKCENPHIKRGIKGFVEFPRVMRAIRSKTDQWGSKLRVPKVSVQDSSQTKDNTKMCHSFFI